MPKNGPIVFHNGSNYDYHSIIKEFKNQFTFFEENTEKYITFTVPIVTRIDKNGEEITKNTFYISQFIDSARLLASSLSNLVNNLSEGIHRTQCKYEHDDKNVTLVELNVSIATVFLNTKIFKMI